MSQKIKLDSFEEKSPSISTESLSVRKPSYGRYLDQFEAGASFIHPRGFTIDRAFAQEYATVFMEANPLYLSSDYAQAIGYRDMLVSPMQVFNIILSLGVQNNSEKAMANLGYYNCFFLAPVYPGDTLTARTKVLDIRDRGEGKPGIVHVRTLGLNQNGDVVVQYERKIMIKASGKNLSPAAGERADFPEIDPAALELNLPKLNPAARPEYTGANTYFEDFSAGDVVIHPNGRTISNEHMPWTYRVGNTHPLHYDRLYSMGLSGPMSGEPIVYGGLVFGWLNGLASRDISENAVWELGFHEGYHTQPAISGDTVTVLSRVLDTKDFGVSGTGLVQLQMIGLKNIKAADAYEQFGAELFIKEGDKKKMGKEKLPAKIFEIERLLVLKKRG